MSRFCKMFLRCVLSNDTIKFDFLILDFSLSLSLSFGLYCLHIALYFNPYIIALDKRSFHSPSKRFSQNVPETNRTNWSMKYCVAAALIAMLRAESLNCSWKKKEKENGFRHNNRIAFGWVSTRSAGQYFWNNCGIYLERPYSRYF